MRHRHLHAFEPASASASARARRRDHPRRLDAGGGVVAVVGAVVGVLLERQPHAHPRRAARVRLARARGDADAPIDVHEPRSTNHSSIEWMNRIESNRIESRATTRRPNRESNERRRRTRRTPPVVRRRARALGVHGRERLTSERTKGPRASRARTHGPPRQWYHPMSYVPCVRVSAIYHAGVPARGRRHVRARRRRARMSTANPFSALERDGSSVGADRAPWSAANDASSSTKRRHRAKKRSSTAGAMTREAMTRAREEAHAAMERKLRNGGDECDAWGRVGTRTRGDADTAVQGRPAAQTQTEHVVK